MTGETEARTGRLRVITRFTPPEGGSYEEKHAGNCSLLKPAADEIRLCWKETREGQRDDIELHLKSGRAEMVRRGETCGHLRFAAGERLEGEYMTPYGALDMAVRTRSLLFTAAEDRGEVLLDYYLYVNCALSNRARMELQWRL